MKGTSASPSAPRRATWLRRMERWLELPMLLLSFAWIALFVIDEVRGLNASLQWAVNAIWIVFIAHFLVEFTLAPDKSNYLKRNWLSAVALVLPALRVFRVLRVARFMRAAGWLRSVRLVRVVGTFNRGMRALGRAMRRRGAGYVIALTVVVTFIGAAGMFAFERDSAASGINSFGDALWWTAMIMTTMGSEQWPQTTAGRVLCVLLSLYAFTVFGYVTAMLASFFVGRDAPAPPPPTDEAALARLEAQLAALREELAASREPPR
ncbi:ion transporter [Lysobacter korlensis]|uniref:Ion transporter n=1 Tax=Lysobacter korlensis TaxID=553636 RepID=A0ABV6RHD3_9GAMM